MSKNAAANTPDYPTESDKALNIADRAEELARELISLPKEERQRAVQAFLDKNWKPEEIKALLSSVSAKIIRKLVSRSLR